MTPGARIAAAIEVLDAWLAGTPAEVALTRWGRGSRYAGSGDRAAVRDLVYDALRCRRSFAWAGGAETGRGLMLGALRLSGRDPAAVFTGEGHAPRPPLPEEAGRVLEAAPEAVRLDCPDWLMPLIAASLGPEAGPVLEAGRSRAPVWLRVNAARIWREAAAERLAAEGIATRPHPQVKTALEVIESARRISGSESYREGLVEVQDAQSQAVVAGLGPVDGVRVLDYCAGAGGKALHLAASGALVTAHDAYPRRMRDLGPRAARAGTRIEVRATSALQALGPWPLVVVDAPCSGSGTWRRDPEAKWRLTPGRLDELVALQTAILSEAAKLTAPGGRLAYITCSVLNAETDVAPDKFLAATPGWHSLSRRRWRPGPLGDGFSIALLARDGQA